MSSAIAAAELAPLPDAVTWAGIALLVGRSRRSLAASPQTAEERFVAIIDRCPIAIHADAANVQHDELPPEFFSAKEGWIAQNFFIGGVTPAHDLLRRYPSLYAVEQEWLWPREHCRRTALDWLANFDRRRGEIDAILRRVYGADAALWRRRWRLFFLATAGLVGRSGGAECGVGHYRLAPAARL